MTVTIEDGIESLSLEPEAEAGTEVKSTTTSEAARPFEVTNAKPTPPKTPLKQRKSGLTGLFSGNSNKNGSTTTTSNNVSNGEKKKLFSFGKKSSGGSAGSASNSTEVKSVASSSNGSQGSQGSNFGIGNRVRRFVSNKNNNGANYNSSQAAPPVARKKSSKRLSTPGASSASSTVSRSSSEPALGPPQVKI